MRIGTQLPLTGSFRDAVDEIVEYEKAGLRLVSVPEAYSFDAVSRLGYLAAKTDHLRLMSGVLPLYTRTPALIAMTAAGLDSVSGGRFTLGIGASGPQVIEGFHGVAYDAPLGRTREIVEICRQVWSREPLVHTGEKYRIPLPAGEMGTGLGKPLKLIGTPVRARIPVSVAAIGPKNVALAAEIAECWQPIWVHPGRAPEVWGSALTAGKAKRDPGLGELEVIVPMALAIGDDVDHHLDRVREHLALYIGGMGARGRNFYHDLACRYGYAAQAGLVQDHYLGGRKAEAAQAVPTELARAVSLIGPEGFVREQIAALGAIGATTLIVDPIAPSRPDRVRLIERITEIAC